MKLIIADYLQAIESCNTLLGENHFSFCLSYVPGDSPFREIQRFCWESRHMHTRFKNHYDGPVAIDLTQWAEHHPNTYFEAFLYYLKDHHEENQCVLFSEVPCGTHILEKLEKFFSLTVIDTHRSESKHNHKRIIGFATEKEDRYYV